MLLESHAKMYNQTRFYNTWPEGVESDILRKKSKTKQNKTLVKGRRAYSSESFVQTNALFFSYK